MKTWGKRDKKLHKPETLKALTGKSFAEALLERRKDFDRCLAELQMAEELQDQKEKKRETEKR